MNDDGVSKLQCTQGGACIINVFCTSNKNTSCAAMLPALQCFLLSLLVLHFTLTQVKSNFFWYRTEKCRGWRC